MGRDYAKEYRDFHGKPEQVANRSKRNQARRTMVAKGLLANADAREVDHKRPLSKGGSNDAKNLRVVSRSANRKKGAS